MKKYLVWLMFLSSAMSGAAIFEGIGGHAAWAGALGGTAVLGLLAFMAALVVYASGKEEL